jgi:hypothetical protein
MPAVRAGATVAGECGEGDRAGVRAGRAGACPQTCAGEHDTDSHGWHGWEGDAAHRPDDDGERRSNDGESMGA